MLTHVVLLIKTVAFDILQGICQILVDRSLFEQDTMYTVFHVFLIIIVFLTVVDCQGGGGRRSSIAVAVAEVGEVYSTKTNRIGLTKTYQSGRGNSEQNLGHNVTIQMTWNSIQH